MKTAKRVLGVFGAVMMGLAGCGDSTSTPAGDAGVAADTGGRADTGGGGGSAASISAICARARQQMCATSASCEGDLGALTASVPAACRSMMDAYLACAAASTTSTCEMIGMGVFAGCQSMMGSLESCVAANGGVDGGTAMPAVPAPSEFTLADASIFWERQGQTAQMGTGMAGLGVTPIGGPANGHQFVMTNANVPTGSHTLNCGIGFIYQNGAYTFSNNTVLTQPCSVMGLDESSSGTINWTGGTIALAPAGNTVATLNGTLSGGLGAGPVTLRVVFPPR
ncbi:MAG: hypothetical protein JNK72_19955 [Myxococcales bacterium]|nr:hypothetical protein [Myxococcales bacterium]